MQRFRRLRSSKNIRRMVRETRVDKSDLIYPIFIAEGENIKNPVDELNKLMKRQNIVLDLN